MNRPFVSVVIPVLRDAEALAVGLAALAADPDVEILVVNGGSLDARLDGVLRQRPDARLLFSAAGRGRQMNAGAAAAQGRWLMFLHADTQLPADWRGELRRTDARADVVGGSFRFQLESSARQARLIEAAVRLRVRALGLAYGDQALFVRREAFEALGGYREWPLMEDVDFIRRLRRIGTLHHSRLPVRTSARRWEQDGWWRRSAGNIALQLLFFAGASPVWLARWYMGGTKRPTWGDAVVVMARAPSDPRGKTRLTSVSPDDHEALKRAMLLDTLDAVARVRHADLFVAFGPPGAHDEMQALAGTAARLFPQRGVTLGDRMHAAFEEVFAHGYSSVAIVGSDLPTLPSAYIDDALDRLGKDAGAAVVGPAADGGYYLIGLRAPAPELFASIPWSTPGVLAATVSAAERAGLRVTRLPRWYDVDEPRDLRRVLDESAGAARTRAWIQAHRPGTSVNG